MVTVPGFIPVIKVGGLLSPSGSLQTPLVTRTDLWSRRYDSEGRHALLLYTHQLKAGLKRAYLNFSIRRHAPHLLFLALSLNSWRGMCSCSTFRS